MEEDIKIAEELINASKEYNQYEGNRYYKAMENIIARYKEQEEIINHQSKSLLKYQNAIPKSKVQERIEELKECCKNCNFRGSICKDFKAFNQCTFQLTIKNLQELLEES